MNPNANPVLVIISDSTHDVKDMTTYNNIQMQLGRFDCKVINICLECDD